MGYEKKKKKKKKWVCPCHQREVKGSLTEKRQKQKKETTEKVKGIIVTLDCRILEPTK